MSGKHNHEWSYWETAELFDEGHVLIRSGDDCFVCGVRRFHQGRVIDARDPFAVLALKQTEEQGR